MPLQLPETPETSEDESTLNGSPASEDLSTNPPKGVQSTGYDDGFSNPEYVSKQPDGVESRKKLSNPFNDGVEKRKQGEDVNKQTQDAGKFAGAGAIGKAAEKGKAVKDVSKVGKALTEDPSAALDTLKGRMGDGKAGQAADKAVELAKDAAALAEAFAGDIRGIWKLTKKYWKPLLAIGIIMELPAIGLAIGLSSLLIGQGNPALAVAAGSNLYSGSTCAEMQTALDINYNGKPTHLFISSPSGKFSEESPIDVNNGHVIDAGNVESPNAVAFWDNLPAADKTADVVQWYITARWPYSATNFAGGTTRSGFKDLPSFGSFAGQKAIIFNPKNGKAVLGIIEEFGPAPWTGIGNSANDPKAADQKTLWTTTSENQNGYRIYDPTGFTGRVAGGPPTVEKALGTDNMSDIQFGFAPASWDQPGDTHKLGPLQCTIVNHNSGSTPGVINVPGVSETTAIKCGNASLDAVALYYNKQFTNSATLAKNADGSYTAMDTSCLTPAQLAGGSGGAAADLTFADLGTGSGEVSFPMIVNSLNGGDPVVMYSAPDAIYGGAKSIFVLTGYDATKLTFDVMAPSPGSFKNFVGVNSKGTTLTQAYLTSAANTNSAYSHPAFIIRQKWITPQ